MSVPFLFFSKLGEVVRGVEGKKAPAQEARFHRLYGNAVLLTGLHTAMP
jgi:hypothetical protein